jgi:hypothetical protein
MLSEDHAVRGDMEVASKGREDAGRTKTNTK